MQHIKAPSIAGKIGAAVSVLLIAGAAIAVTSAPSYATKATAKKTGKQCTTCHIESGEKALNDYGKKYKAANPD